MVTNRSDKFAGNWSTKLLQFSTPTWVLNPSKIWKTKFVKHRQNITKYYKNNYLLDHLMKVSGWISPWSNSITEKYKVGNDSYRIYCDHVTHASESRIFFVIISYVTKWCTPSIQIWNLNQNSKIFELFLVWPFNYTNTTQ